MPPVPDGHQEFAGRRVVVMGLGRFGGGVGVTRWLVQAGARVTVIDRAAADSLADSLRAIADLAVDLRLGREEANDLAGAELAVVNPAVLKEQSELFAEIERRGIAWTTELNLFCERCRGFVIGVTGSFGKSTTCAMLAAMLEAGAATGAVRFGGVHLGGNIGRSLLGELPRIGPEGAVVLELSNAQLEDVPRIGWTPDVAVLTNLAPHHLDRHGTYAAYLAAKMNIVATNPSAQPVIAGALDGPAEAALADRLSGANARRIPVTPLRSPAALRVPGAHNRRNAACALTVARHLGLEESFALDALAQFRGLPHRLELVGSLGGVDYVNDSKSTAPSAAVQAIEALEKPIVLIAGGQRRAVALNAWAETVSNRCHFVVLTGDNAGMMGQALGARGFTAVRQIESLERAVSAAREAARAGDAVLFSPGAPSFDRYANFEQRGMHFVSVVKAMV